MKFACVKPCKRSFDSQQGLNTHQNRCAIYQNDDSLEHLIDEATATRAKKRRRVEDDSNGAAASSMQDFGETNVAFEPDINMIDDLSVDAAAPDVSIPNPRDPTPELRGRGMRVKRHTWKILERLPQAPTPVDVEIDVAATDDNTPPPHPAPPNPAPSSLRKIIRTAANIFGLFREYFTVPTHNPDETVSLTDLAYPLPADTSGSTPPSTSSRLAVPVPSSTDNGSPSWAPFSNMSIFRLMNWMWRGSNQKTVEELNKLVHEVILATDFRVDDLKGFDAKRETAKLDQSLESTSNPMSPRDGWKETTVDIEVPDGNKHRPGLDPPVPIFSVPGLHHRSIVQVIKSAWETTTFHLVPFIQLWQRTKTAAERVYDEIYSSDAFIKAHQALQGQDNEDGCTLEKVVCALMFWSDSTHLASFGDASLWPLYMLFGNQSKYVRGKPRAGACHHVAYIPKLPDFFHDFFHSLTGAGPSSELLTHCRRELMHAVWLLLLDEEFMNAYKHGIVIKCVDGVFRRIYPRIFTYSADYPEKVLLATIRNLGACPCPRCKTPKSLIPELGMKRDDNRRMKNERVDNAAFRRKVKIARTAIYEGGKGIKSTAVENLLAEESLVPTTNAFSEKLSDFGFNLFSMLVVDLMHEFELGVWKAVFTHLIRILIAIGGDAVQKLNRRYRQIPTFGRSTIRRFTSNASAMKKLAARDFEDLLQCAIPVFEGLLPEPHNKIVLDLLFGLAEWHAEAKLRMHTDSTLGLLGSATSYLGSQLRRFAKYTCSCFDTRELPREEAARGRRQQKKQTTSAAAPKKTGPKTKLFNLCTYKLHVLGDYVRQIPIFGTSDSYSTQPGEMEHRRVKKFYARTNKNHATRQITRLQRREEFLRRKTTNPQTPMATRKKKSTVDFEESEALPYTPPENHHHISHSHNFPVRISNWLGENLNDPATKDFLPKLQDHLLWRINNPGMASINHKYSAEDRNQLNFANNRLFAHKVVRVNYTSYDIRRGQDSMNPRTHADIMTLAPEVEGAIVDHPFAYARILGVFHAEVVHNVPHIGPVFKTMEFLWVRWFRRDTRYKAGFKARRLHRLELLPEADEDAFGFLDPDDVIRGAHLIPAFACGRSESDAVGQWRYYYVNIFVDRDMFMRYLGGGVGHYVLDVTADGHDPSSDLDEDLDPQGQAALGDTDSEGDNEDSETDSDSDSDETENEPDLGPEDGEGVFYDDENEEGYGEL